MSRRPAAVRLAQTTEEDRMAPRHASLRRRCTGPALALLAAGALSLAAAACGSGNEKTLTKAQVIKRGTAICKAAERRAAGLPEPGSANPFAPGAPAAERARAVHWLTGYADALQASRVGLGKLKAPQQDRRLLNAYLAQTAVVVAKLREAARTQSVAPAQQAFRLLERASRATAAYGFPKGVCQAGGSG
jgi:hypothetical protein